MKRTLILGASALFFAGTVAAYAADTGSCSGVDCPPTKQDDSRGNSATGTNSNTGPDINTQSGGGNPDTSPRNGTNGTSGGSTRSGTNGSGTNGSGTNGSGTNGSGTSGSGTSGSGTSGSGGSGSGGSGSGGSGGGGSGGSGGGS